MASFSQGTPDRLPMNYLALAAATDTFPLMLMPCTMKDNR
jgi:hypothetical protein